MPSNLAVSTRDRLVKARPATMRTVDATFSRATSWARGALDRGLSLIAGRSMPGWAIGVDGYTARPIDSDPASVLGLLSANELVYACMRERMKVLITPTFVVERKQSDGSYLVEDDHLLSALIRRPGPNLDSATLWRTFEASYASIGRLYLEPVYSRGLLVNLNPLNPVYIVERFEGGKLTGYDWQPPDGSTVRFDVDDLITRRAVDWADVPPLIAALGAVDADSVASEYIRGFFYNSAVPSGIIKVKGSWSQEKTDAMRLRWWDVFGPDGTAGGAPAVLDENIESYTRIGVSLNELDSETLRTFIESRICMCFGVPPLIIYAYAGLVRSTYSNLNEAWASFWDSTALPLLREWAGWCDWSLLTQYEDPADVLLGNVRCRFDVSKVGPYQEDVDAKVKLYQDAYTAGAVTMNELRGVMGLDAHPDGDVFKAPPMPPMPYITLPADAGPPQGEAPTTGEGEDLADQKRLLLTTATKAATKPTPRLDADVHSYLRDQYAKARRLWLAGNDAGADAVLREIEQQLDGGLALFGILSPAERKAYAESFKDAARRIDVEAVIDSGDVRDAVDLLAHRCVAISETTRQEIAEVIVKGATEQQTDAEIAEALGALSFDRSKARAPMITRNELRHASLTAAQDVYVASGVVGELEWITAGSDVCDICQGLNGQRVPLGSDFPGGIAPADAHVNCRCDVIPILAEVLA